MSFRITMTSWSMKSLDNLYCLTILLRSKKF